MVYRKVWTESRSRAAEAILDTFRSRFIRIRMRDAAGYHAPPEITDIGPRDYFFLMIVGFRNIFQTIFVLLLFFLGCQVLRNVVVGKLIGGAYLRGLLFYFYRLTRFSLLVDEMIL